MDAVLQIHSDAYGESRTYRDVTGRERERLSREIRLGRARERPYDDAPSRDLYRGAISVLYVAKRTTDRVRFIRARRSFAQTTVSLLHSPSRRNSSQYVNVARVCFQDYDGQARAEKLSRVIITLFGVSFASLPEDASRRSSMRNVRRINSDTLTGGWLDLGVRYSTILADDLYTGRRLCHGGTHHRIPLAHVPAQATRLAKAAVGSYHQV